MPSPSKALVPRPRRALTEGHTAAGHVAPAKRDDGRGLTRRVMVTVYLRKVCLSFSSLGPLTSRRITQ